MNIGEKIKKLRIGHEESQQKLAEELNVSFQSVSKWENNQSYPEISMLKLIAQHYQVSVDYLVNDNIENGEEGRSYEIKQFDIKSSVNRISSFQVWTDFEYNDSIAPVSKLDNTRRRTGAERLSSPSDDKRMFTIAVDKEGKITYAGKQSGWSFSSPCDPYYSKSSLENSRMECFILQPTYMRYDPSKQESWFHCNDYEFVIPKDGFVMVFNPYDSKYVKIFDTILGKTIADRELSHEYKKRAIIPENFITYDIMDDELNYVKIELLDDETIRITYPEPVERKIHLNDEFTFSDLKEYIDKEIDRKLSSLDLTQGKNVGNDKTLGGLLDIGEDISDELENFNDLLIDLNVLLEEVLSSSTQKEELKAKIEALKLMKE